MKKNLDKVAMPSMNRGATFMPGTANKEKRTIDMVWSTGSRVLRQPWFDDDYIEELDMSAEACDLSRLNGGAPLLNTHRQRDLGDVLGVVERAWLKDGTGHATVRFADTEDMADLWRKVESGIIRNVSVGYRINQMRDVTTKDDAVRVLRAINWQPFEISMVPVGADAAAGTRSAAPETNPCEIITNRAESAEEVNEMPPEVTPAAPAATEVTPNANLEGARAEGTAAGVKTGVEAERARCAAIVGLCRKHKLNDTFSDKLIADGVELPKARELVLEKLAEEGERSAPRAHAVTGGEASHRHEMNEAIGNTILHRINPAKNVLTDAGRNFRGMSLLEICRALTEARGVSTRGMSRVDLAGRGMESTSDLPNIVANVANKTLRDAYGLAPQSWKPIAKPGTMPDFKAATRIQISGVPALAKIPEGGELKLSFVTDGAETYALASYGLRVSLSRRLIINDDTNALVRLPSAFGSSASQTESDIVYALFTANAAMGDSVALFHATHKNLGTAGAISVTTANEGRTAMKKQKNLEGRVMNLMPKFLLVAPEREFEAEQLVGPIVPNLSSSVNPFSGKYQILSDARLSPASGKGAWYMAGDPALCDIIEYSYLEGQEGPYIESQIGFDVDGMQMKCTMDFAAKFLDFRNVFKNAGD